MTLTRIIFLVGRTKNSLLTTNTDNSVEEFSFNGRKGKEDGTEWAETKGGERATRPAQAEGSRVNQMERTVGKNKGQGEQGEVQPVS